jgi:hypothetical protein
MSNKIVFDFDKTLTYEDTLLGFYKECTPNFILWYFKFAIYFLFMCLAKIKLINNTELKKIGVYFFLVGLDRTILEYYALSYSKKIKFSKVYSNFFLNIDNPIVISASFKEYLKYCLPDHILTIASELDIANNKVVGLKDNCYGKEKVLKYKLITAEVAIDKLYTDSFSDKPLMDISNVTFIVSGDDVTIYN